MTTEVANDLYAVLNSIRVAMKFGKSVPADMLPRIEEVLKAAEADDADTSDRYLAAASDNRPAYHYCAAGCGFILYSGRQAIWETHTMADMLKYLKEHGIKDVEYRRPSIAVIS